MGLFQGITSIIPTIGSIIGQLLGINSIDEGYIAFRLFPSDTNILTGSIGADLIFTKSGQDQYQAMNISSTQTAAIGFPAKGNSGPITHLILPGQVRSLTQDFIKNAQFDNTELSLSANNYKVNKNDSAVQSQISASAYRIPVGDAQNHGLSSYLSVRISPDKITIIPNGCTVQSIQSFSILSAGDTKQEISSIANIQGQTSFDIELPQSLQQGNPVDININTALQIPIANIIRADGLETLSDDIIARLRKAPCLNRK